MNIEIKDIVAIIDHTILNTTSTWNEVKVILDDGMKFNVASACIPPFFVKKAKEYVGNNLKICTVIGFPNGYNTTETKLFETEDAIKNGADEIDMVINIGMLKEKKYDDILDEIKKIHAVCKRQNKILKVIIETCLLTEDEKIKMCKILNESGAEFIKTSTGFSTKGATFEDVQLIKGNVLSNIGIKAAGGIGSIEDAKKFMKLGATRLGTSKLLQFIK